MSHINYEDILDQLVANGLRVETVKSERGGMYSGGLVVNSATPVRCLVEGGDNEQRGWYWLSSIDLPDNDGRLEPYLIGAFGVYHGNDDGKKALKLNRDGKPALTQAEKDAIRQQQAEQAKRAKAMRAAKAKEAADIADREWRDMAMTGQSDYLDRKQVGAHGLRFSITENTVAVPMKRDGKLVGLQLIRGKDRGTKLEKQYWPSGMDKVGAYHLIGGIPHGMVLVAEGYATAATIHEATGQPVAVAFDAGSLMPVVVALAKKYRTSKILICADDDYLTPGNPGVEAARLAAAAHSNASWCIPKFTEERSTTKKGATDFNDLQHLESLEVVSEQIASHLASIGWSLPQARELSTGGQGEALRKTKLASLLSVDEATSRFSLIYGGKGTLFDNQEHLLVPKTDVLDIIPDHGWREWKLREDRKVVRLSEVGFDPAGSDKTILCNLWGGWPTEPRSGKCEAILDLLRYLCSGEQNSNDLFLWVLRWLAYPIQHPGAKMRTALIFHGPQGTGKNLFFETIMAIYGEYGRIVGQAEIEDKFNDWASRKLFLIADEVVARQELYHVKNKLKSFVTGEWIRINPKNVAAHDEKNHCNVVYLSNEIQPLPLEADDRRHFVIWTPAKLSETFYAEVRDELNAGGVGALHQHLLDLDLADFNEHTKPPETQAKRDLMDVGAGNVQRFIKAWLQGDTEHPLCPCASSQLYIAYLKWCREDGVRNPREANQFIGEISKLPGWSKGHKDIYDSLHMIGKPKRQRMVIPSAEAQDQWARMGQTDHRKLDDQTQTVWLTECFFAFAESLGGPQ